MGGGRAGNCLPDPRKMTSSSNLSRTSKIRARAGARSCSAGRPCTGQPAGAGAALARAGAGALGVVINFAARAGTMERSNLDASPSKLKTMISRSHCTESLR